jgi:hypothetical protein
MPSPSIYTRTSGLGQNLLAFVSDVNADVAALGDVTPLDFTIYRPRPSVLRIMFGYFAGGGTVQFYAAADPTSPEASAQDVDAFFAADPTRVGLAIRAVPLDRPRTIIAHEVVAMYTDTPFTADPLLRTLQVVRNNSINPIAAGGSGPLGIINLDNTTFATVTMTNRAPRQWPSGGEGYAVYDEEAGEWLAYLSCSF